MQQTFQQIELANFIEKTMQKYALSSFDEEFFTKLNDYENEKIIQLSILYIPFINSKWLNDIDNLTNCLNLLKQHFSNTSLGSYINTAPFQPIIKSEKNLIPYIDMKSHYLNKIPILIDANNNDNHFSSNFLNILKTVYKKLNLKLQTDIIIAYAFLDINANCFNFLHEQIKHDLATLSHIALYLYPTRKDIHIHSILNYLKPNHSENIWNFFYSSNSIIFNDIPEHIRLTKTILTTFIQKNNQIQNGAQSIFNYFNESFLLENFNTVFSYANKQYIYYPEYIQKSPEALNAMKFSCINLEPHEIHPIHYKENGDLLLEIIQEYKNNSVYNSFLDYMIKHTDNKKIKHNHFIRQHFKNIPKDILNDIEFIQLFLSSDIQAPIYSHLSSKQKNNPNVIELFLKDISNSHKPDKISTKDFLKQTNWWFFLDSNPQYINDIISSKKCPLKLLKKYINDKEIFLLMIKNEYFYPLLKINQFADDIDFIIKVINLKPFLLYYFLNSKIKQHPKILEAICLNQDNRLISKSFYQNKEIIDLILKNCANTLILKKTNKEFLSSNQEIVKKILLDKQDIDISNLPDIYFQDQKLIEQSLIKKPFLITDIPKKYIKKYNLDILFFDTIIQRMHANQLDSHLLSYYLKYFLINQSQFSIPEDVFKTFCNCFDFILIKTKVIKNNINNFINKRVNNEIITGKILSIIGLSLFSQRSVYINFPSNILNNVLISKKYSSTSFINDNIYLIDNKRNLANLFFDTVKKYSSNKIIFNEFMKSTNGLFINIFNKPYENSITEFQTFFNSKSEIIPELNYNIYMLNHLPYDFQKSFFENHVNIFDLKSFLNNYNLSQQIISNFNDENESLAKPSQTSGKAKIHKI